MRLLALASKVVELRDGGASWESVGHYIGREPVEAKILAEWADSRRELFRSSGRAWSGDPWDRDPLRVLDHPCWRLMSRYPKR